MDWTEEHNDVLRKYFALKFSASQISRKIWAECGVNKSRNAVIGRAHRLGLRRTAKPAVISTRSDAGKPRPVTMNAATPRLRIRGIETQGIPPWKTVAAPPIELACVEVDPLNVTLADLKPKECRWPLGGWPGNDPVTFCGHPRADGHSYCLPHLRLSWRNREPFNRPDAALTIRKTTRPAVITLSLSMDAEEPA